MVSLFYPKLARAAPSLQKPLVDDNSVDTIPYMPPRTATPYGELYAKFGFPENFFKNISSQCYLESPKHEIPSSYPLIVFSPGGGAPRFWYTTIMEDLARQGYIVAAVDHPHDPLLVEFPDGESVVGLNKNLTREELLTMVKVRAQDLSFVINEVGKQFPRLSEPINTTNVIAFGHSLGGGIIAEAMLNDSRIAGGVNLDGVMWGSMDIYNATLAKPFLQFASEAFIDWPYAKWGEEWKRLTGWKLELCFKGASHFTFTDVPLIAEAHGLREKLDKDILGSVDGLRGLEVIVEYISAFARFRFTGSNERLLQPEGARDFPEVKVSRSL